MTADVQLPNAVKMFQAVSSSKAPNGASTNTMIETMHNRRVRLRDIKPLQILRTTRSTLSALRFLPIFTPRQTFMRWRSRRALHRAAKAAQDSNAMRQNWQAHFRLNGLTWHHLYISQDLRRIQTFLREIHQNALDSTRRISATAGLIPLERSYAYLLDNVWDVYNSLERDVLFPWVSDSQDGALMRALGLFEKERARIERAADAVQIRFSRAVCATGHAFSSQGVCRGRRGGAMGRRGRRRREKAAAKERAKALATGEEGGGGVERRGKVSMSLRDGYKPEEEVNNGVQRGLRGVSAEEVRCLGVDIGTLIGDVEELHRTERKLLYPLIASRFGDKEQMRLTNVLVYSMRASLAKFIITIYHEAVQKSGSRTQWKWYKREVPLPIRVYTPIWRVRLYDGSPLGWLRNTSVKQFAR